MTLVTVAALLVLVVATVAFSCSITEPDTLEVGAGHTWSHPGHFLDQSWTQNQGDSDTVFAQLGWNFGARSRHAETIDLRKQLNSSLGRRAVTVDELQGRIVDLEREVAVHDRVHPGEDSEGIPWWWMLGAAGAGGGGTAAARRYWPGNGKPNGRPNV